MYQQAKIFNHDEKMNVSNKKKRLLQPWYINWKWEGGKTEIAIIKGNV